MAKAYPQVRVFISSTFLDMQKEREILNQEVFPVVKGFCDRLGVAFNMIDLRWGITTEDQVQGNVLEICLDEIQHCKPYFIGLIGNRYGTILEDYDPDIEEKYPFIRENKDKSVTEMEMILGALSEQNRERCFFYYKDPALFDQNHSDGHDDDIDDLKKRIASLNIYHADYTDYKSFKDTVQNDILEAIKADYPQDTDIAEVKQEAYISLHESNYIERPSWDKQVEEVINYAQKIHKPVAAITLIPTGKTTTFNHLINKIENADKIIINFEADVNMRYFPAHYLYNMICDGLYDCGYDFPVLDDLPEPEFLNNYESSIISSLSLLKKALLNIEYKRPLYILINDINVLFNQDHSNIFKNAFLFDNTTLPDNLNIIVTANDYYPEIDIVYYDEMDPAIIFESAKDYFVTYLSKFGKRIDQDILNHVAPGFGFYEYKLAADYLILYCNFSSYKDIARNLLAKRNHIEILLYIYDRFIAEMNVNCISVFTELLLRIYFYEPGLPERDLFASYSKETALEKTTYQVYTDLSEIEKATIMRALRYFSNTESGIVYISDQYKRSFIKNSIDHFTNVLAQNNSQRTRKAFEDFYSRFPDAPHKYVLTNNQVYTKDVFTDEISSGIGSTKIMNYAIFDPACISLDAIITKYAEELKSDEDAYEMEYITDHEIQILVTVQEAAKLYKRNTRADLYAKLLRNVDLMLFVCCKSHALLKRLIQGYIDLNIYLTKPHSEIGKKMVAFAVDYEIKNIMNASKEEYPELLIEEVVNNTILILEEYDLMYENFLDIGKSETRTFATRDYAVNACSAEAEERAYKIDYICNYADSKEMENIIPVLSENYQNTSNIFDKLLYAYYLFKAVDRLVLENMITGEILEKYLRDHIWEINQLRHYCFYPEITGPIVDFLSRIKLRTDN